MKNIITILAIIFTSTFYSQELGRIEFFDTLSNKTVVRKFNLRYMKFISPINKKDTTYIGYGGQCRFRHNEVKFIWIFSD